MKLEFNACYFWKLPTLEIFFLFFEKYFLERTKIMCKSNLHHKALFSDSVCSLKKSCFCVKINSKDLCGYLNKRHFFHISCCRGGNFRFFYFQTVLLRVLYRIIKILFMSLRIVYLSI